MSGHIALDWLWHLFARIPLTRFLHFPRSLKTTDPAPHRFNIYGILTIRASQTSINLNLTGVFYIKKFRHSSLPSTNIHNILHFAQLLCWTYTCLSGALWSWWSLTVTLPGGATFESKNEALHVLSYRPSLKFSVLCFFTFVPLNLPVSIWSVSLGKGRLSYIFTLQTTQFQTEACHLGKNARITYLRWISVKTM